MNIDTSRLIDDADIADVAERIGLEPHRRASNIFITCPNRNHDEVVHDNCCICRNHKGYKCFSCGDSGDAIKMVRQWTGAGFVDAAVQVADTVGGVKQYTKNAELMPEQILFTADELRFLGLKRNITVKEIVSLKSEESKTYNEKLFISDDEGYCYGKVKKTRIDLIDDSLFTEIALSKVQEKIRTCKKILCSEVNAGERKELLDTMAFAVRLEQKIKKYGKKQKSA